MGIGRYYIGTAVYIYKYLYFMCAIQVSTTNYSY